VKIPKRERVQFAKLVEVDSIATVVDEAGVTISSMCWRIS